MLSIQTNVNSMNAQENLRMTTDFQGRTISRLTSGYRINQSGDDAAGLSVANKFRSDVAELTQGVRNANDGLSTLQIIDGGLSNIAKIVDRLKTLATQSASSTFTGDRSVLNTEYTSLLSEIDRQAAGIGLGSGDTNAGRFNANIQVYIGGGSGSVQQQGFRRSLRYFEPGELDGSESQQHVHFRNCRCRTIERYRFPYWHISRSGQQPNVSCCYRKRQHGKHQRARRH